MSETADELANGIKKSLEELEVDHDPSHAEQRRLTNVELSQSLTPLFSDVTSQSSKRSGHNREEGSYGKSIQKRCNECQLDSE